MRGFSGCRALLRIALIFLILIAVVELANAKMIENFDDGHINLTYSIWKSPFCEEVSSKIYNLGNDYCGKFIAHLHGWNHWLSAYIDIPDSRTVAFRVYAVPYKYANFQIGVVLDNGKAYYYGISKGVWHYVYAVLIGDTLQIYVDGHVKEWVGTRATRISKILLYFHSGDDYSINPIIYIDDIADYDFVEVKDIDNILYKTPETSTYLNLKYIARPWASDVKINIRDFESGKVVDTINLGNKTFGTASVDITNWDLGLYQVELIVDNLTASTTYFYYADGQANYGLTLDKNEYYSNELITATYNIDPYDSSYGYYIKIYDSNGDLVDTIQLTSLPSGTIKFRAPVTGGTYFVILMRSDGAELAYDSFGVIEKVLIRGYVKDQNGKPLANALVSFNQAGKWYNATTDSNGYYQVAGLLAKVSIDAKASLTGYESDARTLNFDVAGIYYVNFTLINSTLTGIYGIIRIEPFGNPISGAKVTVYNDTWNATVYSNSVGFYDIKPPSDGTYTIKVEKERFKTVQSSVEFTGKTRMDFTLKPLYLLTVKAKTTLGNYLSSFQVSIENKDTGNVISMKTENGTAITLLPPGLYSISVTTSDNKFYGIKEIYLNNDTSVTVVCSLIERGSQTIQYAPTHSVTLQIIKAGHVLVGVPVAIKDITTGRVINLTTDGYGSVVFWANKTRPYEININNGEKVLTLYPASDYYIINIGGGFNISTNQTRLNFTNITLPVPGWLKLPVEVFLLLGCCCLVLAGTRSNMPFALLMATILLGFGVWSGLTPHVPYPVIAVSAFITGLSFLRRGEES